MVKQNNNSIENVYNKLYELIELENISDVDLKQYLRKYPKLLEIPDLFRLACKKFRADYIESFLEAGISRQVINQSGYQEALFEAGQKFLEDKKKYSYSDSVKYMLFNKKFIEIDNEIKNYLTKKSKVSKR